LASADEPAAAEIAAYHALVRVALAVPRAVTADIGPGSGLGLSEYLVLDALASEPGGQLRLTVLAGACGLSLSGISRTMSRLDRAGLTRRTDSPDDGRGTVAVLTEAGRDRRDQARPLHLASIRRHILSHLAGPGIDIERFTSAMERIADSLLAPARAGEPAVAPARAQIHQT
jgi:DNA-binding MarR family transcriptional regulator